MCARILIADEAGACYGVERALELVRKAVGGELPVKTLGPLIHNPAVVDELAGAGVSAVEDPADAAGELLVLRTHGVSPEVEAAARELCAEVIDAACPFVKRVHMVAKRMAAEGRRVVIVGEHGHPEAEATRAQVEGAIIVSSPDEARAAELGERVGVVVQTTMAKSLLDEVMAALCERVDDVVLENTICDATSGHQRAAAELAREADAMVVVGGRNSANTRHLAEIARDICPRTHHIEDADELEAAWFEGAELIGITAGASTPASQIEAVRARIAELAG